jgi:hypothetical protein
MIVGILAGLLAVAALLLLMFGLALVNHDPEPVKAGTCEDARRALRAASEAYEQAPRDDPDKWALRAVWGDARNRAEQLCAPPIVPKSP